MRSRHTLFLALLAAACMIAGRSLMQAGEISILRSDARGFVFEYRPQYLPVRQVAAAGQEFVQYDFPRSTPWEAHRRPGQPDLRCRLVGVSLPSQQGNSVQVLAADYEDIAASTLSPVPLFRTKDGIPEISTYAPDASAYAHAGFLPETAVASLPAVNRVRTQFVGAVVVTPVQFNPALRVIRRYSRIIVEVVYGAPAVRTTGNPDGAVFGTALLNGLTTPPPAQRAARTAAAASSVLKSGKWYRLSVADDGVYKLDATYLAAAGISVAGLDPRTIKIYGNGGRELPEDIAQPRPQDLVENAILVQGEADGKFDPGDYVLFYGRSVRGWNYDASAKTMHHTINHYSDVNYYWLTYDGAQGKRMAQQPSDPGAATVTPDRFRDGIAIEEEKVKLTGILSGKDWYARLLDDKNPSFTYVQTLPGLVPSDVIQYRFTMLAHSDNGASFTVREGATLLGTYGLQPISGYVYAEPGTWDASGSSSLAGNSSQVNFTFNANGVGDEGYIDWLEIFYPRFFFAVNDYLHFWSPDTDAIVEYQLQQFAGVPLIFNVTVPENVTLISGVAGTYGFRAHEAAGRLAEYVAAAPASWKQPAAIQAVPNQDLRGLADGADFIILTSSEFRQAADRLAAYRQQPAHGNLRTLVLDVSQVYNEFGGGIPDITAIRDYLKYAYDNWTKKPQFVLFFGGASYDYKGILGAKSSYVPTWQSDNSIDDVDSWCTDDYFTQFGGGYSPWLVTGRISSRTTAEANVVVDKILRYEDNPVRDNWKMRICYVADDAWTTEGGEIGDRTLHGDAAEDLAVNHSPDELEKKKIYIAEYPTLWTAQGRLKPGAYQAIIDQVNQGVLILNYTGHGNPTQLAHENIFNVQTSIPQLANSNRLALFFLATCNFSQFDDPRRYTGSEILMNKPDGGSVAVVSATRKVYANNNNALNTGVYDAMFLRDSFGRLVVERPATALFQFKGPANGNYENDQKYVFLGDPTMRLQFPSGYASIDSINGIAMDSAGVPRATPVQVRSLSRVTVAGTVRDQANQMDATFNGRATLVVNDASRTQTIVNYYPGTNWNYTATGGVIFRGENSVSGGRFHATFVVPKDISYGDSTGRGRVVGYLTNDLRDAEAYSGNIVVGGTDTTARNNGKGPQVAVFLNSRAFKPGDLVNTHPVLLADLADSSGINTSGAGIGHRIEAWLNNSPQSIDLTDSYTSKLDNYREGTVQYQLNDLPAGQNTLRLRAWDSFNNSSVVDIIFKVASDDQLAIADVLNYPNPFASGTSFTFRQNQSSPLNVRIKIYTVAGRLIQTLETTTPGEPYVRVPWDGRDRDGDILANGVYLYKIVASTIDGRFTSEALGKLAVLK